MIAFLLDTNVCIDLIRGNRTGSAGRRRSEQILAHLRRQAVGAVGISSITLAELWHGVASSSDPQRNRAALLHFCAPLSVEPFDQLAAGAYGDVRRTLETAGTPIGPLDLLIAAHALSLDVTLVTNNDREFRRVKGLQVENWTTTD